MHCGLADVKQRSYEVRVHHGRILWSSSSVTQSFFSWLTFANSKLEDEVNYHKMMFKWNLWLDRSLFEPNPHYRVEHNPVNIKLCEHVVHIKGNDSHGTGHRIHYSTNGVFHLCFLHKNKMNQPSPLSLLSPIWKKHVEWHLLYQQHQIKKWKRLRIEDGTRLWFNFLL